MGDGRGPFDWSAPGEPFGAPCLLPWLPAALMRMEVVRVCRAQGTFNQFLLPVVAIDSAPCIGRFVFLSSRPGRKWSSRLRRRKWSSRLRRAVC